MIPCSTQSSQDTSGSIVRCLQLSYHLKRIKLGLAGSVVTLLNGMMSLSGLGGGNLSDPFLFNHSDVPPRLQQVKFILFLILCLNRSGYELIYDCFSRHQMVDPGGVAAYLSSDSVFPRQYDQFFPMFKNPLPGTVRVSVVVSESTLRLAAGSQEADFNRVHKVPRTSAEWSFG